jgi:hypothetical protein
MTISRKIIEINKEDINNILVKGFNSLILEETDNTYIVELWCSDNNELLEEERKTADDLNIFISSLKPIKILESHQKSPAIIGRIIKDDIVIDEG